MPILNGLIVNESSRRRRAVTANDRREEDRRHIKRERESDRRAADKVGEIKTKIPTLLARVELF